MKRALWILVGATLAWPAAAATNSILGKHNTDQPINITADKMDADLNAKTVTYVGNVVVTQGDIRMHANTMKVTTAQDGKQADKIYADGKVLVDSPASGTASGDSAVYDVRPHLVTLTGHVVLTKQGKATMRGTKLTVDLDSGQAQLGAQGAPGGRVQGVFTPSAPQGN